MGNTIENSFEKLFNINVNEKTEKKGRLTYLSWAWAWSEFKKVYPNATYTIRKNEKGLPYFYDEDSGYMCFTEVSIGELSYEMWLPVMDSANKALKVATMFDINKTVMRCLTKNLAMFGLGLYIYAGEDLPESESEQSDKTKKEISAETMAKVKELEIDLTKTARHNGVEVDELTETQITNAIEMKLTYLAKQAKQSEA